MKLRRKKSLWQELDLPLRSRSRGNVRNPEWGSNPRPPAINKGGPMKQFIFTPKWENGKHALRPPNMGEIYETSKGNFVIAQIYIIHDPYPIYTRTEVEIPDPEPIGWVFRKTGEVRSPKKGEYYCNSGLVLSAKVDFCFNYFPILSCTPIYEGDE